MPFHNPYHFVPTLPRGNNVAEDLSLYIVNSEAQWPAELGRLDHSIYASPANGQGECFSGRIVCRLEAVDPLVVGGLREQPARELAGKVHPFMVGDAPAIPATSLRGLVSTIAEAATNSSLRVLTDRSYSYRKQMTQSISAIGMIAEMPGSGSGYGVRPMSVPNLGPLHPGQAAELPARFGNWFPRPNMKVYIGYRADPTREHPPGNLNILNDGFGFSSHTDQAYRTQFSPGVAQFWGLRLDPIRPVWTITHDQKTLPVRESHYRRLAGRMETLLGEQARGIAIAPPDPFVPPGQVTPVEWEWVVRHHQEAFYTKGVLRVLGCWGNRESSIPTGKKHEVFIPYNEEMESWRAAPVPKVVWDKFHELADERSDASEFPKPALPYEPRNTRGNRDAIEDLHERRIRLKPGDLVFFDISANGEEVSELSLSSIWRNRVEQRVGGLPVKAYRSFDFFSQIDRELLPFHKGRTRLTLAEQMFGFVENNPKGKGRADGGGLALASRIRFSAALAEAPPQGGYFLPEVTLRILDSPKLPCPALYFKPRNGQANVAIGKSNLNPSSHAPQGRKMYLHRQAPGTPGFPAQPSWRMDPDRQALGHTMMQHARVTPVRQGTNFWFHIDFDNLSAFELGVLLYALRPTPAFHHKLGMGKPIGLGKVSINVAGLFLVDRERRYTAADYLAGVRYHERWLSADCTPDFAAHTNLNRYQRMWNAVAADLPEQNRPETLRSTVRQSLQARFGAAITALERIGETQPVLPVCYPFSTGAHQSAYAESELFEWFKHPDPLQPIGPAGLPTLES